MPPLLGMSFISTEEQRKVNNYPVITMNNVTTIPLQ